MCGRIVPGLSGPFIICQYDVSLFWQSFIAAVLDADIRNRKRRSGTYLTCSKLTTKVGAVYDQRQADGEPDEAESAGQKDAAVAPLPQCGAHRRGHVGDSEGGSFVCETGRLVWSGYL